MKIFFSFGLQILPVFLILVGEVFAAAQDSANPSITLSSGSVRPGDTVEVRVTGLPGNSQDWLTLVDVQASPSDYGEWTYTNGVTEGSWTFTAPKTPGDYEIRVFFDFSSGDKTIHARAPMEVVKKSPKPTPKPRISVASQNVQPREVLKIEVENLPGNKQDWITIVAAGAAPGTFGDWAYTQGQTEGMWTFKAPAKPGSYEIRVHFDYPNGGNTVQAQETLLVATVSEPPAIELTVPSKTEQVQADGPSLFREGKQAFNRNDFEHARKMYEQSCETGHIPGCNSLGMMLVDGAGGPQDRPRARELYGQACQSGYPMACDNLGLMFYNGWAGPKNKERARELYDQACKRAYALSCFKLGSMYENGEGGDKDLSLASSSYSVACKMGNGDACQNLRAVRRRPPPREQPKVPTLPECNDQDSCLALAKQYGWGNGVELDYKTAIGYAKKSCDLGSSFGCYSMDVYACNSGDPKGCYNLGLTYAKGDYGMQLDREKAAKYSGIACDMGLQQGCDLQLNAQLSVDSEKYREKLEQEAEELSVEISAMKAGASARAAEKSGNLGLADDFFIAGLESCSAKLV